MKCEDCLPKIEEYLDGELDKQSADGVAAHMAGCRECASYYEELKGEQMIYARYERDIDVSPALWAGVRARIREEQPTGRPGWFSQMRGRLFDSFAAPRFSPALAALIVLVTIGATVGVMSYLQSRGPRGGEIAATNGGGSKQAPTPAAQPDGKQANNDQPGDDQANKPPQDATQLAVEGGKEKTEKSPAPADKARRLASARRPAAGEPTPEQLIREAEQKYIAAINILSRDVNRRRRELSPEALARFETTIAQIDHAINETRRAVRQNPDDPLALNYMLAAYSKKVEVLREIARGD
jgi:hypothetical protein